MITVEFLGIFHDYMGCKKMELEPGLVTDVFSLIKLLSSRSPKLAHYLNQCCNEITTSQDIYNGFTILINGHISKAETIINDGDHIVITIPMSGG
mgnify:CR=1 FL=1